MIWAFVKQQRRDLWMVAVLLFVALTLGGGGWHNPALVGVIEALAIPVLIRFGLFADHKHVGPGAVTALLLIAAMLALGLMELVPLPPTAWRALPGRTLLAASLALQNMPDAHWSISVVPQATRLSMMAMLPPVAMFVAVIHMDEFERRLLCGVVSIVATLSAMICLLQVSGSEFPILNLYGLSTDGLTVGFFANRNHQAVFLDCAILFAGSIGVASPSLRSFRATVAGVALFPLAICVLGTASRSGTAMLGIAVLALLILVALARMYVSREVGLRVIKRRLLVIFVVVVLFVTIIIALISSSYQGERLLARVQQVRQDGRYDFWPDVLYVARLYFPMGAGFGTFTSVFDSSEPLALVNDTYVVHAHNDYIELFIECGVAAVALVGIFILWLLWRAAAAWRTLIESPAAITSRAASVVVLLILLHSLVDYPLRTEAMGTLFAFACALLVPSRTMTIKPGNGGLRMIGRVVR